MNQLEIHAKQTLRLIDDQQEQIDQQTWNINKQIVKIKQHKQTKIKQQPSKKIYGRLQNLKYKKYFKKIDQSNDTNYKVLQQRYQQLFQQNQNLIGSLTNTFQKVRSKKYHTISINNSNNNFKKPMSQIKNLQENLPLSVGGSNIKPVLKCQIFQFRKKLNHSKQLSQKGKKDRPQSAYTSNLSVNQSKSYNTIDNKRFVKSKKAKTIFSTYLRTTCKTDRQTLMMGAKINYKYRYLID